MAAPTRIEINIYHTKKTKKKQSCHTRHPDVVRDEHHLVARLGLHQSQQAAQHRCPTGQLRTDTLSGVSGRVKLQQVSQLAARLRDLLVDQVRVVAQLLQTGAGPQGRLGGLAVTLALVSLQTAPDGVRLYEGIVIHGNLTPCETTGHHQLPLGRQVVSTTTCTGCLSGSAVSWSWQLSGGGP